MEGWRKLGSTAPSELIDATLQLHWAVQFVASAGQTFAEHRADDSHRAMSWDVGRRSLVGAPFSGPYPFRVALRPEDLTLLLLDRTEEPLGTLPLAGVTRDQGYEWLATGLATYMGGAPPEIERPEYDLPEHPVAGDAQFGTGLERELGVLGSLYGNAAYLLGELISTRDDASPILCWPHHFDIATLITVESDDDGKAAKTVGAGWAPMGGGYESWYWYVSPWPYPDPERLPALPGPGAWHTAGWTGAVLTGQEVIGADEAFREAVVRKFLDVAVEKAIDSLKR